MSSLSLKRYAIITVIQYALLLFDLCVNSFSSFARENTTDLLILYITQDFAIIAALILLLVTFFSTYIFQVGLIQVLYVKYRFTLLLCITYLILSIALHTWHIKVQWLYTSKYRWTNGFYILYSTHRTVAVLYYFFHKRACLTIADPKFHQGSYWVQKQFNLP